MRFLNIRPLDPIAITVYLLVLLVFLCCGCSVVPKVKLPGGISVTGPRDPGKPAEVNTVETVTSVPLPAGTQITVVTDPAQKEEEGSAEAPQTLQMTLPSPVVMTQRRVETLATTGTVDPTATVKRIEVEQETALGRNQQLIGTGLILAGIVVGFVLPGPLRWPLAGVLIGTVGMILVIMPTPPPWLIPTLLGCAVTVVVAFYVMKHQNNND